MGLLFSLLFCAAQAATPSVPDYSFQVSLDPASKVPRWLLDFKPPPGNHFNLGAPMKSAAQSGKVTFARVEAKKQRVRFASSDLTLKEGEEIEASIFLCDEAKTYCIRKVRKFPLRVTPPADVKRRSPSNRQDQHGFFVNQPEVAVQAAVRAGKPLLIDFYGIWCPPCNLYNENVFPSAAFKQAAKGFVLLKIDADDERFFNWKTHFRIGGYPTFVVTRAPSEETLSSLVETDRMVGYFSPKTFANKLKESRVRGARSPDERVKQSELELVAEYRRLIPVRLEQKDEEGALILVKKGLALVPTDPEFKLRELALRKPASDASERESSLRDVFARTGAHSDLTLMIALDLVLELPEGKGMEVRKSALEAVRTLEGRLDPATLMLPEVELSLADLVELKKSILESLGDGEAVKSARKEAILAYRKLLKLGRDPESRGFHLELASLLWRNGEVSEAKAIYSRFIEKYPDEFTFHHAAAGMYLELKELKEARKQAELAVRFAYGDNLIRTMERLTKIMAAEGESEFAIRRARQFLEGLHVKDAPGVRTARYVAAFRKTIESIEKGSLK